jgi:uncharacterized SAM-binding protein YcdF (DUF218 family)
VIRLLKVGLLVGLLLVGYFAVTFVQVVSASRRDRAAQAQAIVVLGAAQYDGRPSAVFRARLDHAADLYARGIAPVVVVTGGRREGDRFTEASAAAGYLERQGVPGDRMRLETSGRNSWESLAAAARFLRAEGIRDVVLVSSPYHALRIEHIASEVGLRGRSSPADTPEGVASTGAHIVRETLAVGIGRIIGYRRLVDLDHRVDRVRERER